MKILENGVERDATQSEIDEINSRPLVAFAPASVSPRQARLALNAAGLLDAVETAIAASPREVQLAWEYSVSVQRDDPTLAAMAAQLGLTEQQMDDLFRQAAAL
jgi:predicted component of type VI protein secretion system